LKNKIALAEEAVLRYISAKVCEDNDFAFDAFGIGLTAEKARIRPRELFEADLYLVNYATQTGNVRVFANDKELPMVNGKALFNQTYQMPGTKKVDANLSCRIPGKKSSRIASSAKLPAWSASRAACWAIE